MASDDLRAFLRALAAAGELIQASAPLDPVSVRQTGTCAGDGSGDPAIEYPPRTVLWAVAWSACTARLGG